MAAADLRMRVDRKDDEAPRKLAQAERAARYDDQKRSLKTQGIGHDWGDGAI